jgi:hypothetical protein
MRLVNEKSPYAGYRFPAEVNCHAVWLYFRFPLALRMVENLLAARGIIVSHETIRQWALKFGQTFANQIRRRLPRRGDKWHLDEVVNQDRRGETLALACGGSDRDGARRSRAEPTQHVGCQAPALQAAEAADASAPGHDHRQACQLQCGKE